MDPDIALFVAVVQAGSLSAAGRSIGTSPATVSKRIARLERRLGVRLIHRTTRRLSLTTAGERFHADAVDILAALARAEARVAGHNAEPAGPVRLSAPTAFGRMLLAPHLPAFLDRYPRIELELNLSDALVDLVQDRVDLAIRITTTIPNRLVAHRLAPSQRVLCAAPAYLERHGVPATLADLQRHRVLAAAGQMPWRLIAPDGPHSIDLPSHVRTNSSELVRELALAGGGLALRSLWEVGDLLTAGTLIRVLPQVAGSSDAAIHLVHADTPLPAAATALLDFLRTEWAPERLAFLSTAGQAEAHPSNSTSPASVSGSAHRKP